MAGRLSSFTGIAAIAGLLATLVTHLGPVARTARVAVEEAAPAIRQAVELAPNALQVVPPLPSTPAEESSSPAKENPILSASVTTTLSPSLNQDALHQELQRELAIEEAQRGIPAGTASPLPSIPSTTGATSTVQVSSSSSVDPRPMSIPQVRRCLDYKGAVAKAVEKAMAAKASLDAERTLLVARDTELSSAIADEAGQDPGEHLNVQIQADQLRADVAAHDRRAIAVRDLADSARDLGDRYNRTCSGRRYSDETYQAALQLQATSQELPTP